MDKLRKDNDNLKTANESLRRERQYEKQKALSTYEASGMSYHALNQTVKALSASKQKLSSEVRARVQALVIDLFIFWWGGEGGTLCLACIYFYWSQLYWMLAVERSLAVSCFDLI